MDNLKEEIDFAKEEIDFAKYDKFLVTNNREEEARYEPLMKHKENPYTIVSVESQDIRKLYDIHMAAFWHHKEVAIETYIIKKQIIEVNQDYTRGKLIIKMIKHMLAYFAGSDGIVVVHLNELMNAITNSDAMLFYQCQSMIEGVHSIVYSNLLKSFCEGNELKKLMNAIYTVESIKRKAEWALKYITPKVSLGVRLIAFALVEGIFFSSSFATIYWVQYIFPNKFTALVDSNLQISKDESLHVDFAVTMYRKIVNQVPSELVYAMTRNSVECECAFAEEVLGDEKFEFMNLELMTTHIQHQANIILKQLGYSAIYDVKESPFIFISKLQMQGEANFFSRHSKEYKHTADTVEVDFTKPSLDKI